MGNLEEINNELLQRDDKVNKVLDKIYNQGIDPQELNPDTIIWALETLENTLSIARAGIIAVQLR